MTLAYDHGLVVGKFYPPHAGHHYLIDEAQRRARRLTIIVAGSRQETIPLELRVKWLRERHPAARVVAGYDETPVDLDDPAIWDAHIRVFRDLCPEPVDAVFSSEEYGDELARRFDARHVAVDRSRSAVPISGTVIRADPAAHWSSLAPSVRAWLTRRVAIVGAESTGTTTLAREVGAHYLTECVPERGRAVTESLVAGGMPLGEIDWSAVDFRAIATAQLADEDARARRSGPVLVCDTEAMATCVWQERYQGRSTADIEDLAANRSYALYILTSDDVPFEQDGLRDGEHLRGWTQRFRERLAERPEPWIEVAGPLATRIEAATAAVNELLRTGWSFGESPSRQRVAASSPTQT